MFRSDELTPMLAHQPGVCDLCRGWSPDYTVCYQCHEAKKHFQFWSFPVVLPLALAVHDGPLARALADYKYADGETRSVACDSLRQFLESYGKQHLGCLLDRQEADAFDLVAWVPSSRDSVRRHPIAQVLSDVGIISSSSENAFVSAPARGNERRVEPERFLVDLDLRTARVLLVDDTWTSGGSALSAAYALYKAEAETVSILTLGRHFRPEYRAGKVYSHYAAEIGFDPQWCTLCDPRPRADPPLPSRARTDDLAE